MSNIDQIQIGGSVSPITSSLTNTLLKDADPGLDATLKFLTAVLKTHFEARFTAASAAVNYKQGDSLAFTNLVPTSLHYDPEPYLVTAQYKFPMLAIYRFKTNQIKDFSFAYLEKESLWRLAFIMPPFDVRQAFALNPILNEIENVIFTLLKRRHAASYQNNDLVLDNAGIKDIDVMSVDYAEYKIIKSGSNAQDVYPTLSMELRVRELQHYVDEPVLNGIDIVQDVTDDLGTVTIINSEYNNP
jgi:hypothetical protein